MVWPQEPQAPAIKVGQRVAYGQELGTIRWIGRMPHICHDWTAGIEFDNAIGDGDGSLNGRRYFVAKDCFSKFVPLSSVIEIDEENRLEWPREKQKSLGDDCTFDQNRQFKSLFSTIMSNNLGLNVVKPGQMISIQRIASLANVFPHCFLNAPHQRLATNHQSLLSVNNRMHCQCPNCGPCAHLINNTTGKSGKNATHMCQFSTYVCCPNN